MLESQLTGALRVKGPVHPITAETIEPTDDDDSLMNSNQQPWTQPTEWDQSIWTAFKTPSLPAAML